MEAGRGLECHTYESDGSTIALSANPRWVELPKTAELLADQLWDALDVHFRVLVVVRGLATPSTIQRP